jgi:hypothetical protein
MSFFYSRAEYLRPWKLATFAFGVALMIAGARWTPAPDWDVPISVIMPALTYLTAPCAVRTLADRRWRHLPLALFFTWFSVDGCYAVYWYFRDAFVLETMRSANAPISLILYGLCGIFWLYRGSLRELQADVRRALTRGRGR